MGLPSTVSVTFPFDYGGTNNKVTVIRTIRCLNYMGLKEAKDLCETQGTHSLTVNLQPDSSAAGIANDEAYFEELCRILRNNGCVVGPSVHLILQSLRDLAAEALKQGDDDLANEILQLVLAEKLRRKP